MKVKAISTRHGWGARIECSATKSETECRRCGVVRASLKSFDKHGRGSFWKEFWRDGERLDAGDGTTPPCDARLERAAADNLERASA